MSAASKIEEFGVITSSAKPEPKQKGRTYGRPRTVDGGKSLSMNVGLRERELLEEMVNVTGQTMSSIVREMILTYMPSMITKAQYGAAQKAEAEQRHRKLLGLGQN